MTNLITWEHGRFSEMEGRLKNRRIGSISYTTKRGAPDSESYILRMGLIGGGHQSLHPTRTAAQAHAERVLVRQMALLGFVPAEDLESLRRDSQQLARLEAAGVDNWEGYSSAFREDDGE